MQQLAGALRDLNPALNNYLGVQADKINAADFEQGQLAYTKAKTALKEAVDTGKVAPGYSPAFQRGYQQGQLRMMGLDYDEKMRAAYSQSAAANSDDPNAFQSFVSDFTSQYVQANNIAGSFHPVDVAQSFNPAMDAAQRSLAAFHVEQRAKTMEDNWQINTQNEISTTIDNAHANAFTPEQTAAAVSGVIGKAMANGWHDKTDFNRNVVDLVAAKAVGSGDAGMLDILKHIPSGPGGTVGNTTYARDKALEATQRISNQQRENQRWDWAQQDRAFTLQSQQWAQQEHAHTMQDWAIEKSAGTLMRAMVAQAILNPTQDFSKQAVQLANMDRDGSHARTFEAFRQAMLDANTNGVDHPAAVTGLYQDMLQNPQTFDPSKLVQAHNAGSISLKTMQSMMDDQRSIAAAGQSPILRDPVYQTLKDGLAKAFYQDPNSFDVTKQAQQTNALMAFQRHALDYLTQHKSNLDQNAFFDEMQAYQQRLVKPLLDAEAPKPQPQASKKNPFKQPGMTVDPHRTVPRLPW
jgi:hypothetical protein